VAEHVRRQPFACERRARAAGRDPVAREDVRDAPATERLSASIHEDLQRRHLPAHGQPRAERSCGRFPQRQGALSPPFAADPDGQGLRRHILEP
jgi:hypothetical protein